MNRTVQVNYMGYKDVHALRADLVLPREIVAGIPDAYGVLFEHGMEIGLVPAEVGAGTRSNRPRIWMVGRAARPGDPAAFSEAEADRRAEQ